MKGQIKLLIEKESESCTKNAPSTVSNFIGYGFKKGVSFALSLFRCVKSNDYIPDYEYLKSLGFKETNTGENHPYERENEIKLNDKATLCMDAFFDFHLDLEGHGTRVSISFEMNEELEDFINAFKS